MKLDIIVRTCSKKSVTQGLPRIVLDTRADMILKCIDSLIKSSNICNDEIVIKVLDDHSDAEFLEQLTSILNKSTHPVFIKNLEIEGFNHSAYAQFNEAKNAEELVYFVEDDYFHSADAIDAMLSFYKSGVTNDYRRFNSIAIYPYDCAHRYWPGLIDPSRIFYQGERYWRTINQTANTVMMHSQTVRNFWPIFENLALNYPSVKESDTLNLLYSNLVDHGGPVACFSPIPSVAYHISYENEPPNILTAKFTNWKDEWNNYERN